MDKSNCPWVRRNLTAYGDNQLGPADRTAISQHLSHCPDCRQWWDEQHRLNQMLDHLTLEPPPPELTNNILLAIKPLAEAGRTVVTGEFTWWDFSLRGFALLVSTTLLAVLSWVIYLGQRYGWAAPPRLMWLATTSGWEKLRLSIDHWATILASTLYNIWSSAVNWPAHSGNSLLGNSLSLWQQLLSHRSVLAIVLVGLLVWLVVALVTTYFSSRIFFDHGEERI
ncbi:hypothetical protein Desca_0471 [Desulfotomaculum nigrificans CO-1-SRB]|uniref:Anti-sigma-W factor RsiW n=1 Tax=Desulfotomaculum nigrificans (strain DSM 14880 / VKM B-2319 / CO-1-SRB) TaxID=868595 RepID=F6B7B4_DESCC|nr:zf-HC2 domain-containing protein [Desulfotomaculum nigrificans]AEF93364.1 hypothetical protein Desca_0471 [Desulfotomaculum nigrificans CO-1-SRB]